MKRLKPTCSTAYPSDRNQLVESACRIICAGAGGRWNCVWTAWYTTTESPIVYYCRGCRPCVERLTEVIHCEACKRTYERRPSTQFIVFSTRPYFILCNPCALDWAHGSATLSRRKYSQKTILDTHGRTHMDRIELLFRRTRNPFLFLCLMRRKRYPLPRDIMRIIFELIRT